MLKGNYNNGLPASSFFPASPCSLKTSRLEAVLGLVLSQVFSSVREFLCKDVALMLEEVGLYLKEDAFVDNGTLRNLSEQVPILLADLPGF